MGFVDAVRQILRSPDGDEVEYRYVCSQCGTVFATTTADRTEVNCPECGARTVLTSPATDA